jgi:hypothetical protein
MPNVRVGDLVLELDKNLLRRLWRKAKIVTLLCSRDGLICQVRILQNGTEYTRALAQLCPLDVNLEVNPGANPTIASYNASVVKIYSAVNSMARL